MVLLLSGAGGFDRKTRRNHGRDVAGQIDLPLKCPKPCWYAYMDIPGNFKTRVPQEFIRFIEDLHARCSHNKNSIVAWGFSRGARLLEELVRKHSAYLDVAVIIAGYPETKGREENFSVAWERIAVKRTIVSMVHFAADQFCNASI